VEERAVEGSWESPKTARQPQTFLLMLFWRQDKREEAMLGGKTV